MKACFYFRKLSNIVRAEGYKVQLDCSVFNYVISKTNNWGKGRHNLQVSVDQFRVVILISGKRGNYSLVTLNQTDLSRLNCVRDDRG
jgi:hypothetical protein